MRSRPDELTPIALPSGTVFVNEHGYITDPEQWSEDFAHQSADSEGIALTPEHWAIIDYMRSFHDEHRVAADQRFVLRLIAENAALDKAQARRHMHELFPGGYVKQACKIAGMRQPLAWSTG